MSLLISIGCIPESHGGAQQNVRDQAVSHIPLRIIYSKLEAYYFLVLLLHFDVKSSKLFILCY